MKWCQTINSIVYKLTLDNQCSSFQPQSQSQGEVALLYQTDQVAHSCPHTSGCVPLWPFYYLEGGPCPTHISV